jgi:multidrug efflux pump subunit AcrA (membrane-fusion protein)
LQKRFLRVLKEHAHLTYAARVAFALAIGLFGLGTVFAFSGSEDLANFRSSLTAAVAGSVPVVEEPIVLSGVSVVGEVVPARELALSARASGVIQSTVRVGEEVSEGGVVLRVDDATARRAVRSAEVALAAARLSVRVNANASAVALSSDSAARTAASTELSSALRTGYEEVASILPFLPDVISGLSGMLYGGGFSDGGVDYLMAHAGVIEPDNEAISPLIARAGDGYVEAKRAYDSAYAAFHKETEPTDAEKEAVIIATDDMLLTVADTLGAVQDLLSFVKTHRMSFSYGLPEVFAEYEESLTNYVTQVNDQQSLTRGTRALVDAARAVMNGDTPSAPSPESAELEVRHAELALEEAQARLANHELRAPFGGTIARLDKRTAHYVSDGETVALLVARDNIVRVWLAQGEAARITIGTRVLASIEGTDISVPGVVEEMDAVGKKNEDGAIVFEAVIGFPKPDERLRPGMQVNVGFEGADVFTDLRS